MLQFYNRKVTNFWKVQRLEYGVIHWRIWWRGGRLLKEATAKYHKQWRTKSELSEVG